MQLRSDPPRVRHQSRRIRCRSTVLGRRTPAQGSRHKDPSCGCCGAWVTHVKEAGFPVEAIESTQVNRLKTKLGVPRALAACHTAEVGGYVVEGHVPAADIHRMLKEKPAIAGIAVGGMPVGSPGMESPYVKAEPFNVMSFDKSGATRVFAKH